MSLSLVPRIRTLPQLLDWFRFTDRPTWMLFAGENVTSASKTLAQDFTSEDINTAWDNLQRTLANYGNVGLYSLFVKKTPKSGNDAVISTVIEFNPYSPMQPNLPQTAGIGSIYGYSQQQQPTSTGIGSIEVLPEVKHNYEQRFREMESRMNEKLAAQKRELELEYKVKLLEEKVKAPAKSTQDRLIDGVIGHLPQILGLVKGKPQAQLGILDTNKPIEVQQEQPQQQQQQQQQQQPQQNALDMNVIIGAALQIQQRGVNVTEIMKLFAQYVAKNDAETVQTSVSMLKTMLNS